MRRALHQSHVKSFLLLLFSLLAATGYGQTIYYVDSTAGNDANTGLSWGTAFRNVTRAVTAANASAAAEVDIWVSHGTYHPVDGIAVLPADTQDTSFTFYRGNGVTRALKLYGGFAGTEATVGARDTTHHTYLDGTIPAGNSYHVVVITGQAATADSLVIDGFTIRNGAAYAITGKIYNGVFAAPKSGGGIYLAANPSGKISIRGCTITRNLAGSAWVGFGPGNGAGMFDSTSSPAISNCTMSYNTVHTGNGGGMYAYASSPQITGSNFIGNTAYSDPSSGLDSIFGGGICNIFSPAQVVNCYFKGNFSQGYDDTHAFGGGISNSSSAATVINSVFDSNSVASTINHNGAGGGIFNLSSAATIAGSSFIGNYITSTAGNFAAQGGGIANFSCSPGISSCTFIANRVTGLELPGYGGGIFNSLASPVIDNCTFTRNMAYGTGFSYGAHGYGGGICNSSSSPVITNCSFLADTAYGYSTFVNCEGFGGAVCNLSSASVMTNCNFDSCRSYAFSYNDGYGYGGALFNLSSTATVSKCHFAASGAFVYAYGLNSARGASVCNQYTSGTFDSCTFTQGIAQATYPGTSTVYGGAVYEFHSSPSFSKCQFTYNTAFWEFGFGAEEGYGGAVFNDTACAPGFDSCYFLKNYTIDAGGAIYQADSMLTVHHCTFDGDSAKTGGAICINNITATSFKSYGNVFVNNISRTTGGGAISLNVGTGKDTLVSNVFLHNKDIGANGGGALYVSGGTHFIANNTFYLDTATTGAGGAILFAATGAYTVANNIFYKDYAATTGTDTGLFAGAAYTFANNSYSTTSPQFTNPAIPAGGDGVLGTADDGLHLQNCSPARNTGLNSYVPTWETADVAGAARIGSGTVDMGAYESNAIGNVLGATDICVGHTETLTDTPSGGTWISVYPSIATVGSSSGVVTGATVGVDTVWYVQTGVCGTDTSLAVVVVNSPTSAGVITGTLTVCVGNTTLLGDTLTGGTWSASNAHATVVGGLVTGVSAGLDTIYYTNSCGGAATSAVVTVNPFPSAGTIIAPSSMCQGTTVSVTDGVAGGLWGATNTDISVVAGAATGLLPGVDTITYSISTTCGLAVARKAVTVNSLPSAGTITGTTPICATTTTTYTDPVPGGTWSAANGLATIVGGLVTGVSMGLDTIMYIVSNGCGIDTATADIYINPQPVAGVITGPDSVCVGSTITIADVAGGGFYTMTNAHATYIGGYEVTGVSIGVDSIQYSVTNMCGTAVATKAIVVDSLLPVAAIAGPATVCVGASITLSDATAGGTWSAGTGAATLVGATVTGVSAGTDPISYSVADGCGTSIVVLVVTIDDGPASAGTITGSNIVCEGSAITLTDGVAGGAWTATNAHASVSGGTVTGATPGTDTVVYTVSNTCGSVSTSFKVTIGNCALGTGVIANAGGNAVIVYPVPATGNLTIENAATGTEIKLYNMPGQQVYSGTVVSPVETVDIRALPPGSYIIQATGIDGNRVMMQVVKTQ